MQTVTSRQARTAAVAVAAILVTALVILGLFDFNSMISIWTKLFIVVIVVGVFVTMIRAAFRI